ncbi:hypothetical protein Pint_24068 [Pistacia integerrima]|uniref:Uncharacterized protein n=1 Tax=Pistacia integerrima TaxID=434235 RepID=A0ACC0YHD0_9ROSI|nr:hypothetical protein Pint_24068 [Pistacia integerrima]
MYRLNMNEGILEGAGDLFKKVHGINMFEYMSNDPTFSNIFNKAMVGISQFRLKGILEAYRGYEGLASLVDVGGGTGKCLHMITSMYPHIKASNMLEEICFQVSQPQRQLCYRLDMVMLAHLSSGKERTTKNLRACAEKLDFPTFK